MKTFSTEGVTIYLWVTIILHWQKKCISPSHAHRKRRLWLRTAERRSSPYVSASPSPCSYHISAGFLLNWSIQLFTTHTKTARVYLRPIKVTILSEGKPLWISTPLILISWCVQVLFYMADLQGGLANKFPINSRCWFPKKQNSQRVRWKQTMQLRHLAWFSLWLLLT